MKHICLLCLLFLCHGTLFAQREISLQNKSYRVLVRQAVGADPVCTVERVDQTSGQRTLIPELCLVYSDKDPQYTTGTYTKEVNTPVVGWKTTGGINTDLWKSGTITFLRAKRMMQQSSQTVTFGFEAHRLGDLILTINLPPGNEPPLIRWSVVPRVAGWFSIGLTGIQAVAPDNLDFLYQPMVWSWKRFPAAPVLTSESFSVTAASFTNYKGATEGLSPDPSEIPYRFATFANSRFGLALRDAGGLARPMLFAPILGGAESSMKTGKTYSFGCRYFLEGGDWNSGVKYLLNTIFRYRNERQNASVTLNQTLENMIEFALNDRLSGWIQDLKGFDYTGEVPGTVKGVSPLHSLSLALTTGNMDIYRRRALPMMEYAMSREKFLFSVEEKTKTSSPSHFLYGPGVEIAELTSLNELLGGKSLAFQEETNRIFGKPRKLNLETETGGTSWQDYLAKYRQSKEAAHLNTAKTLADAYIQKELGSFPKDFQNSPGLRDKESAFVTDFGPRWFDLLELYEETKDKKYLNAATTAARQMLLWLRSNPMAPDSLLTVNRGGRVAAINSDATREVAEQQVQAWRTSLIGLPPEQPFTYHTGGPIMLTQFAAWMLRLGYLTNEPLFRDAAYNAMLGRYANFPGYYFTSLNTTVYQQPDYPLVDIEEFIYNVLFYNHVWPHIALIQDFLVSDVLVKSKGQVTFPSAYSPAYAYMNTRVYGHKPGTVFGNQNVRLWLPQRAISSAEVALNHVFGYSDKDTYLILTNTHNREVNTELYLNPDAVRWNMNQTYPVTVYAVDGTTTTGTFRNGKITVKVPPAGLIAIRFEGMKNRALTQQAVPDLSTDARTYFRRDTKQPAIGNATGMLFNLVPQFTDAYVYVDATEKTTRKVKFTYKLGDKDWVSVEDSKYPFEFELKFVIPKRPLQIKITAEDLSGKQVESEVFNLKN